MTRPPFEVADIICRSGSTFIDRYRNSLTWGQLKVLRAIERCRTAALGGHRDRCLDCRYRSAISFHSCRNRHCPKCQTNAREKWLRARQDELLPVNYFHIVFSIPHDWCLSCGRTRGRSSISCLNPALRPCSKSAPIQSASEWKSAFSASCIRGGKHCSLILTYIASCREVGRPRITPAGSAQDRASFCR